MEYSKTITNNPMLLSECINFLNEHYHVEPFVEWQPSEHEMKHTYNTPRRLKKLEKDRVDHNAKLKVEYNSRAYEKSRCIRIVERFDELPVDISSLFFKTIRYQVEDTIAIHEKALELREELKRKYNVKTDDSTIRSTVFSWAYEIYKSINLNKETGIFVLPEDKKQYYSRYCDLSNLDVPTFYSEYHEYKSYKDKDIAWDIGLEKALVSVFKTCIERLSIIKTEMIEKMEGVPEHCERESNWGVGGYYNGILVRGDKRLSFKSFIAGGYNIQKRHIRFRMTLLKN